MPVRSRCGATDSLASMEKCDEPKHFFKVSSKIYTYRCGSIYESDKSIYRDITESQLSSFTLIEKSSSHTHSLLT
ncbi:hypothetical protein T08_488 [Trichinella sp. T8]|nr:hypothetical protein T08_488 [Trichinella sp. T8]